MRVLKLIGKLTLYAFFSLLIFKVGVMYSDVQDKEFDSIIAVMRKERAFLVQEFKFIPNKYGYTVIRKERMKND